MHLADAFEKQKNNSKAIEMLQKYISKTNDVTAKNEINNYIEQLKIILTNNFKNYAKR